MNHNALKLFGIYLGNLFEHYDTALYAVLSPLFARLFFPEHHPITALIFAFAMTPLGMIARPLGSLFFGSIGDRIGRSTALFFSLFGMAIATMLFGCLPTHAQVGPIAPILLLLGRIAQNFFAAGENMGGAVYFLENIQAKKWKDIGSSIYNTSSSMGILLASICAASLYRFENMEFYWRYLYFAGACTALCGVFIRWLAPIDVKTPITQVFSIKKQLSLLWMLKHHVALIAIAGGFSYATYCIGFSFLNGFSPIVTQLNQAEATTINSFLLLYNMACLPLCGILATRFSRERMMMMATLSSACIGLPLFYLLDGSSFLAVTAIRMAIITLGVAFSATFHSWSQEIVPKEFRYSTISFAYAIGSQLFGGTTATLSLWLYHKTGMTWIAAGYWVALAGLTFAVLKKKRGDLKAASTDYELALE